MIDPNMPNNKAQAEIYLNAQKVQLLDLGEAIVSGKITKFSEVNGYILKEVNRIEASLEGE